MSIDWTKIFLLVISLASAIITSFLIPYLKQKLSDEQLNKTQQWLTIFCMAAETAFETGAAKKEWVLEQMEKVHIQLTPEQLDSCLEAVVRELTAHGIID